MALFFLPFPRYAFFPFLSQSPFHLLLHHGMKATLELEDQVRRLRKEIAQVKNEIKEHPYIDGISLYPIIYLA